MISGYLTLRICLFILLQQRDAQENDSLRETKVFAHMKFGVQFVVQKSLLVCEVVRIVLASSS